MTATTAIFAFIVLAAFTVEAAVGFGSMLIAVTLGAHALSVSEVVPIAVPLDIVVTAYLVTRHRQHIAWRLLLTSVLPLMGVGLAVGQVVFYTLGRGELRYGLGVLVVIAAWRELARTLGGGTADAAPLRSWVRRAWLFGAGVIQGIYATGGPPLVYVVGRERLDKRVFRSTLATVWLVLNGALTVSFLCTGTIGRPELARIGTLLPVVVVAIAAGELLHHRVDERRFRIVIFSLLLVAGAVLLLPR